MMRTIRSVVFYGLLGIGCTKYVKPPSNPSNVKISVEQVAFEIRDNLEAECDRSYVTHLKDNTLVVCDEKFGNKYRIRFGLPLEKICDVSIEERHFPPLIEFLWKDILYVRTQDSSFQIKMRDRTVKKLGSLLATYIGSEKECQDKTQEVK